MCGIFGVLHLDGSPVDRTALKAMAQVTVHRGPDDEGFHLAGACGIGMRRLSIIDVAGGQQPLTGHSGGDGLVRLADRNLGTRRRRLR